LGRDCWLHAPHEPSQTPKRLTRPVGVVSAKSRPASTQRPADDDGFGSTACGRYGTLSPIRWGVELHSAEVARRLVARGVEVTVLTTDVTGKLELCPRAALWRRSSSTGSRASSRRSSSKAVPAWRPRLDPRRRTRTGPATKPSETLSSARDSTPHAGTSDPSDQSARRDPRHPRRLIRQVTSRMAGSPQPPRCRGPSVSFQRSRSLSRSHVEAAVAQARVGAGDHSGGDSRDHVRQLGLIAPCTENKLLPERPAQRLRGPFPCLG
jgi:hypothetical protein